MSGTVFRTLDPSPYRPMALTGMVLQRDFVDAVSFCGWLSQVRLGPRKSLKKWVVS